jgi:F0F1-type ATP synthase assembly protein I
MCNVNEFYFLKTHVTGSQQAASKLQNHLNEKYMDVAVLGVMIPIIAIIGTFTMIVYLRKFDNQERMAMIEKGVDPQIFVNTKRSRNAAPALRASLLLIGIGLGFLVGYFLDRQFHMEEVGYFSMLFIFGGIGLGLSYMIEERKQKLD